MTVGDKGLVISIDAGGFNMVGATATLLAAPGNDPASLASGLSLTPLVIASDGLTATYTTTGTDFQASGPWQLQIEVQTASGEVLTSAPGSIYVNPRL